MPSVVTTLLRSLHLTTICSWNRPWRKCARRTSMASLECEVLYSTPRLWMMTDCLRIGRESGNFTAQSTGIRTPRGMFFVERPRRAIKGESSILHI